SDGDQIQNEAPPPRGGPKAEKLDLSIECPLYPKSGQIADVSGCPLCAKADSCTASKIGAIRSRRLSRRCQRRLGVAFNSWSHARTGLRGSSGGWLGLRTAGAARPRWSPLRRSGIADSDRTFHRPWE